MTSGNKRFAQRAIAVVVIITLLDLVGVAPALMLFVTGVVLVVWFISRRSQNRELRGVFDFYVAADNILRDEDRRWFAFELVDVIDQGESALDALPDPPPLQLFALGALYHKMGNYDAAAEYLKRVNDSEFGEESRMVPSPQLRTYVSMLRRLEREPSIAPLVLGAVRNLERARRKQGSRLLAESRSYLADDRNKREEIQTAKPAPTMNEVSAPPPISEVLQHVYDD